MARYTRSLRLGEDDRFILLKKIASGTFGHVFVGLDISVDKEVAVKVERAESPVDLQLLHENNVYKDLKGGPGIPNVLHYQRVGRLSHLVMDYLGPSIQNLFEFCSSRFTLKTILLLAQQMLQTIEYLHSRHYIHRDLKPDNFVMGRGQSSDRVYLIDYGLAMRYMISQDPNTNALRHIHLRADRPVVGTVRFISVNTHLGVQQSRRDDLETFGYMLLYLFKGSLPWEGIKVKAPQPAPQKYIAVAAKKNSTPIEELCKGCPPMFAEYMNYCRALKFEEQPNYQYLSQLFSSTMADLGYTFDAAFDWKMYRPSKP